MHALLLSLSLVLQSAAPAPATEQLGQAYFLVLEGRDLDEADQVEAAIARYQAALKILPSSAPIYAELAGLYARQGAMAEGRAAAERALELDPRSRPAHRILGLIQAALLQTATPEASGPMRAMAITHLERALADDFQDLAAEITLGELYLRNGQLAQAITTLEDFLLERPGYSQAQLLLAEAYRASGKPAEADRVIGTMRAAPVSPLTRLADVEQLENRGRWREAASGWADLADESPARIEYRLRQATALANGGALDDARQVLTDVTASNPKNTSAWHLLARIEQRAGRAVAADEAARRITAIDPADPHGPLALAEIRGARRDYRGVVAALEPRVLAASKADVDSGAFAEMASRLGDAWIDLKEPRRAVQALEAAHQRVPDDERLLFSLAATAEQARQFDRAERAFRDLIARNPTHAPALNYLGYMLADRNTKLAEALGFITRALAEDEDNPSYLDSLGWTYYRLSQYTLALPPLERAAADVPESSVIQDHLGDLYVKLQRYGDAVAAFERALAGDGDGITPADIQKKRDRARTKASTR